MISLHEKIKKDHRCYGYIINSAFRGESEMVWYFTGVYTTNKTIHGRSEMSNFSSSVEKIFHWFAALTSRGFVRQPCCMAGTKDSFSYGKISSFLCKTFSLFLPYNMAAVQSLCTTCFNTQREISYLRTVM